MNIYDLANYSENGIEKRSFSRELRQDEPLVKELFKLEDVTYRTAEHYIKDYSLKETNNYHSFYLNGILSSGNTISKFHVYERNYMGLSVLIKYGGNSYRIDALENGNIETVDLFYSTINSFSNHIKITNFSSIEEINKQALEIVMKDKRKIMNRFNKEIRDLKQDYKSVLKNINEKIKLM